MSHKQACREWYHRNKHKPVELANKKKEMINLFKDSCVRCGSTKKLDLHHPNPLQKMHRSDRSLQHLGWDKLKEQLGVMICLCKPCHQTIHKWFDTPERGKAQ
jgi:hypothetical protein